MVASVLSSFIRICEEHIQVSMHIVYHAYLSLMLVTLKTNAQTFAVQGKRGFVCTRPNQLSMNTSSRCVFTHDPSEQCHVLFEFSYSLVHQATLSLLATQISGRTELYALVPRVFRKRCDSRQQFPCNNCAPTPPPLRRISAKVLRNLHDNLKAVPHDATGSLTRLMEHLKGPNSIVEVRLWLNVPVALCLTIARGKLAEAHYPDNEHLVDAFHEDGRKIMAYVGRFTRSYRKEIQYEDLASKKAGLILDLLDSVSLAVSFKSQTRLQAANTPFDDQSRFCEANRQSWVAFCLKDL